MKKYLLMTVIASFFVFRGFAQDTKGRSFNKNGYQAWVTTNDGKVVRGLLWIVDENSVFIKSSEGKDWKKGETSLPLIEFKIENISSVRTKRVHAVWKGYGYGVLTGVAVGTIGALVLESSGDEFAILAVPLGGFIGSGLGLISGAMPDRKFKINGSKDLLKTYFPDLDKRAFWSQLNYNRKVSTKT